MRRDLDGTLLERRPALAIVHEAGTQQTRRTPKTRKRYLYVEELVHAEIDVFIISDAEHIESLNDMSEKTIGTVPRDNVPESTPDLGEGYPVVSLISCQSVSERSSPSKGKL